MVKGQKPEHRKVPDFSKIKEHIEERLGVVKKIEKHDQKTEHKENVKKGIKKIMHEVPKGLQQRWIKTDVPGFDELSEKGIPKGTSILVCGGCGSGKTIFCMQTLVEAAKKGEKCLYLSFEETEIRLKQHMVDFGWDPKLADKGGNLRIVKHDPFKMSTAVEALLAEARGELMIDIKEVGGIIPNDFKPTRIAVDSLSAIAAAFGGKEGEYRIFIEQLFEYFKELGVTSFLISETEQVPTAYSRTGIEEFLADGVVVMYNIKKGDIRTNALEFLKMRGTKIKKKIVPFEISSGQGIEVFPDATVFGGVD